MPDVTTFEVTTDLRLSLTVELHALFGESSLLTSRVTAGSLPTTGRLGGRVYSSVAQPASASSEGTSIASPGPMEAEMLTPLI
jgi:hypothetical protein